MKGETHAPAGRDTAKQFERLRREIDAMFRAADRRNAELAADAARELHLDRLAERFASEANDRKDIEPEDRG